MRDKVQLRFEKTQVESATQAAEAVLIEVAGFQLPGPPDQADDAGEVGKGRLPVHLTSSACPGPRPDQVALSAKEPRPAPPGRGRPRGSSGRPRISRKPGTSAWISAKRTMIFSPYIPRSRAVLGQPSRSSIGLFLPHSGLYQGDFFPFQLCPSLYFSVFGR